MKLNIAGQFESEEELHQTVKLRKICYETGPFYITGKNGELVQIGYQLSLHGTFPAGIEDAGPDSPEYESVERDVRRVAEALSNTCGPVHMCESTTIEPSTITYSRERKMRPDVTVRIPVFDQKSFGHPVDENITNTLHLAEKMLEAAGVHKTCWLN